MVTVSLSNTKFPQALITRDTCRLCGKDNLDDVISLGNQNLINFIEKDNEKLLSAPLELVLCDKLKGGCGLLQLRHTVPGDLLYRQFWYKSGVNQTIKNDLKDIVKKAKNLIKLEPDDIVIDIGANDGTLLRNYEDKNIKTIGFEPAKNLISEAKVGLTEIINDFFNSKIFFEKFQNETAKIITSISMFYDLENPNEFVNDIVNILDKNGIWVIQMNYLVSMLENNAFDNIVHEHLEYYSLQSLEELLNRHNLTIFNVELNEINGGSIRTYVKHKDCIKYSISSNVEDIRNHEKKLKLDDYETYEKFANRIKNLKTQVYNFIENQVKNNYSVYVYGASTRGNTLLQYFDLNNLLIKAAIERNPMKWGKKIAGTNIPIISEEQARKENPDFMLILPWYFIDEFIDREKDYLEKGGKFIVPLPFFKIIEK